MTTIYTFNSKVLKNTVNDKWLIKKAAPLDEVQIGNQIWKNKNLAIDDGQGGIYTATVTYGNETVTEYFYTLSAALRIASTIQGWHIPTLAEFQVLLTYANSSANKLKSTYGWSSGNGTDDYGFKLLPAGLYDGFSYHGQNEEAWVMCYDPADNIRYGYRFISTNTASLFNLNMGGWSSYFTSVRLIKD